MAANIAANSPHLAGEFDEAAMPDILQKLKADDAALFEQLSLGYLLSDFSGPDDPETIYTAKVKSPVYEPKSDEPPLLSDMCRLDKTVELVSKIDASEVSDDIKAFLRLAAQRHLVFNYETVAEYYAHAPADVQRLMEDSALVIIDFNQAIENGFVRLSKELGEAADDE